jgi:hypothetical protein
MPPSLSKSKEAKHHHSPMVLDNRHNTTCSKLCTAERSALR